MSGSGRFAPTEQSDEVVHRGGLEKWWNLATPYTVLAANFMMFSRNSTGEVRIYEIQWDGNIGGSRFYKDYKRKWTAVRPFHVLMDTFVFMLKVRLGS